MVKVGCCGFPVGKKEYLARFKLVEVQQTFYKVPRLETAIRWRREAPADFEFTIKASQLITHHPASPTYRRARVRVAPGREQNYGFFVPSEEVWQAWEETRRFAEALKARIIVFQCPPSFAESTQNINSLRRFFRSVHGKEFLFVWEPRGGWSDETVKTLCSELELIHCVDPFVRLPLYGKPQYFRLHGGPGYRHRYSEEEMKHLKSIIGERETYVLFNNVGMYGDALTFKQSFMSATGETTKDEA